MQRYSTPNCVGGFTSNSPSGISVRDNVRADPSFSSSNYTLNSRRSSQLASFKLKCERPSLNSRIGPPDFYPQTPNCPEETLTREYLLSGYKETVEGIEEAREIVVSELRSFSKPVILKCKEAIRKRQRAINESRAQKRKAGQVYGVSLSGHLLSKPGLFPDQRPCGEDSRKKWIEGLSQQHKRLRSLADHVPHGYRKKFLLEVIIRHNVPLLRATWFIKVTYLNQVRSAVIGTSSGGPDKTHLLRAETWTKDLIEYLHNLLDEFFTKDGFSSLGQHRNQASQSFLSGSSFQRAGGLLVHNNGLDPSLQFKWGYVVRLLQWHYAEGLLLPSLVIEWVLTQLQEKDLLETWDLLMPVIVDLIESIAQSQTYIRIFVDVAVRFLRTCPASIDLTANARKPHLAFFLVEIVRYLLLAVPDAFVCLDCFPLPLIVAPSITKKKYSLPRISGHSEIFCHGSQDMYNRYLSFGHFSSSLCRRTSNLSKIVNPCLHGHGMAKAVQTLDKSLIQGDARIAYNCLFEDLSDSAIEECWITEVSPALRSSLKWIGKVSLSLICAVFFLCEWATSDFRDFRTIRSLDAKVSGTKDFCQVYIAVFLLKLKMEDMQGSALQSERVSSLMPCSLAKNASLHSGSAGTTVENPSVLSSSAKNSNKINASDTHQKYSPLHDIIVCWLDQHDAGKGEGFKRLEVLVLELIRHGIFSPPTYVRQLLVSGIMDRTGMPSDLDRQRRHHRILRQLPGSCLSDVMGESKFTVLEQLHNSVHVYSSERHLLLHGICSGKSIALKTGSNLHLSVASGNLNYQLGLARDGLSPSIVQNQKFFSFNSHNWASNLVKAKSQLADLKAAISALLHLPYQCHSIVEVHTDEHQVKLKRSFGSLNTKPDSAEGINGCEECTRTKKQKVSNERVSSLQGLPSTQCDDDDTWWVRKGPISLESLKTEQPKSAKHSSRGRQKSVRKTSSLAQLAAARIESSQGASTSHVCDNKVSCPHHKSAVEADVSKSVSGLSLSELSDIGKALKKLRWLEKRSIAVWLLNSVMQLIDENEKSLSVVTQNGGPFTPPPLEEKNIVRWKFGEDDLLSILYLLDVSADLYSSVKFLIWLLPKITRQADVQLGRNTMPSTRNKENTTLNIGEAFLLSALQRYENVIVICDLLPEALSAAFHRATVVTVSNPRISESLSFIYARNLLKKYGNLVNVEKWEKGVRDTCERRLLAEIDSGRSQDADGGYKLGPAAGLEDLDDYFRQKMSGRTSRAGPIMKDIVQRHVEEAALHFLGRERKQFGASTNVKLSTLEKWDDGNQVAYQIVLGLLECMRHHGGSSQEGDPLLVAAAVSAIVGNVGPAIAKLPDSISSSNHRNSSSSGSLLNCIRRIVNIHIMCLSLLKEAVGERLSHVLEVVLAAEASSNISVVFCPGKVPRGQFQLSPETHDTSSNISNDYFNSSSKIFSGRASKIAAGVSALLLGAIVSGVSSLEKMITVLKLKEGLDIVQFIKNAKSGSNGISRSIGNYRTDHCSEVYVHWYRLLIGNCRTVFDGLIADILGESYILALFRMQRMLPLSIALSPSYSIFTIVIWRAYIIKDIATREDIQLYNHLSVAIGDTIKHQPFRDLCMRDSHGFYDLLSSDANESEIGAMLELHNPDKTLKSMPFVPLRSRLFLNAIVDCAMPLYTRVQDDGSCVSGHCELRDAENETKLLDRLVHVLDTLQPAKFHWQWVELRLLLNEQILIEKIETHGVSLVEALHSLSSTTDIAALSEYENTFTEIVLTRLLIRPDAASLYSEIFHLLGRSLEEKLLLQSKWILAGNDVLLGRKSIRQRLVSVAQLKGLSTKAQSWKPWGWPSAPSGSSFIKPEKKLEVSSLEEGEVVEEGMDTKKSGKSSFQLFDGMGFNTGQNYSTDKAFTELVLPTIDRSSNEARTAFVTELIKQMNTVYQHINALSRGTGKQSAAVITAGEGSANKVGTRKGIRGGSPGLGRRPPGTKDSAPPSAAALRASIWLRLHFLLRLLPVICAERQPSNQKLRHMLASVLLHLLSTPIVYEDAETSFLPMQRPSPSKELELKLDISVGSSLDLCGDSLFDMISSVLYGLLCGCKPSWLNTATSKSTVKSSRDFSSFDRDITESLQAELDHMQLPSSIRRRLQTAIPMIPRPPPLLISCSPPMVSSAAFSLLQPFPRNNGSHQVDVNPLQRVASASRPVVNTSSRSKLVPSQDADMEVDPWTLLEDGTDLGSASTSSNSLGSDSSDHSNLKASCWLKGAVRMRRTYLTYIGATDDDN